MARTVVVPHTDTSRENDIVVIPGTSWLEDNFFATPDTRWTPRIDAVPGTTREMWTSIGAVPGAGTNHVVRQTVHFTQIIDDGEDEDDEEASHDHIPKTVHFGSVEEAECEDDHTAMMAGKHVNDELSDGAMHDIALSD